MNPATRRIGARNRPESAWKVSNSCGKSSMATIQLPPDFKEFLRLLNSSKVEYLVVGGYAVNYYGFSRATADLDLWIAVNPENAELVTEAVRAFGFKQAEPSLFFQPRK